jgi:hypothetical protein
MANLKIPVKLDFGPLRDQLQQLLQSVLIQEASGEPAPTFAPGDRVIYKTLRAVVTSVARCEPGAFEYDLLCLDGSESVHVEVPEYHLASPRS